MNFEMNKGGYNLKEFYSSIILEISVVVNFVLVLVYIY